jgi:hypothetical protein
VLTGVTGAQALIAISNTEREPGLALAAQTVLLLLDKLLKGWLHFREASWLSIRYVFTVHSQSNCF